MLAPREEITPLSAASSTASWTLWLGPGVPTEMHELLSTAGVLADGGRLFPKLADIADLLTSEAGAGRLVLAASALPPEDLGILRRFLERGVGRELVLLADGFGLPTEGALVLPRTRTFPLGMGADLAAHLSSPPERLTPARSAQVAGEERTDRLALAWQVLRERLADRHDLAPLLARLEGELERTALDRPPTGLVDLGVLTEELLAGLSLERDRRLRFLFRPEGELSMRAPRAEVEACLRLLFDLVGRCSSPDSVIRVRVTSTSGGEADPDAPVDTTIEFPDAPLAGLPMGAELDPDVLSRHFGPEVSASLRTLRHTAAALLATLDSLPARPGRRMVRLRLPRLVEAQPV